MMKYFLFPIVYSALLILPSACGASVLSDLMKAGKWTEAKKNAEALIKNNGPDAGLYMTAGICAVNQRNYNAAVDSFSRARALAPKLSLPLYLTGVIFEETGSLSKAADYFTQALKYEKDREKKKRIKKHLDFVTSGWAEVQGR